MAVTIGARYSRGQSLKDGLDLDHSGTVTPDEYTRLHIGASLDIRDKKGGGVGGTQPDGKLTIPLGGAKQRAVLAMLVLHANEVVSTDRLLDELWDGDPGPGATTTLQEICLEEHADLARLSVGLRVVRGLLASG